MRRVQVKVENRETPGTKSKSCSIFVSIGSIACSGLKGGRIWRSDPSMYHRRTWICPLYSTEQTYHSQPSISLSMHIYTYREPRPIKLPCLCSHVIGICSHNLAICNMRCQASVCALTWRHSSDIVWGTNPQSHRWIPGKSTQTRFLYGVMREGHLWISASSAVIKGPGALPRPKRWQPQAEAYSQMRPINHSFASCGYSYKQGSMYSAGQKGFPSPFS